MKKIFVLWLISSLTILASCGQTETVTEVKVDTPVEEAVTEGTNSWEVVAGSEEVISYTMADVSAHNSSEDCWTIVDWKVYDISSFFGKHPGWDENLKILCWNDWTQAFSAQHGWQERPEMKLDSFYIWDLK